MKFDTHNNICIFDTETSELHPGTGRILEIAAVYVSRMNGRILDTFQRYFNHMDIEKIPAKVSELTGITLDTIREEGVNPANGLADFFAFVGNAYTGAHNLRFDLPHVRAEAKRQNTYPEYSPPKFCTLELALRLISPYELINLGDGTAKGMYKLETLVKFFGIELEEAHRADADVRMLYQVFCCLYERFEIETSGQSTFEDWMNTHYQLQCMPWGKHWGKKWGNIPQSYLLWAQDNMDFPIANSIRNFMGKPLKKRQWE